MTDILQNIFCLAVVFIAFPILVVRKNEQGQSR